MNPPGDRAARRQAWVRSILDDAALTLVAASSDASARSYWRTCGHAPSWIVMDAPPALEDARPWLAVNARLAAAGLHVPDVRAHDLEQGFLLIEDLGSTTYLEVLDAASVEGLYATALAALLRMQTAVDVRGLPPYDRTALERELALMPEWFLGRHLGHTLTGAERGVLQAAFATLVQVALEQPRCFVHRDYHSRNLLVPAQDGGTEAAKPWFLPGIIDFQDAVHGPVTYDLVSLLRDCYIAWDRRRVEGWVEDYRRQLLDGPAGAAMPEPARFLRWFDLMGLQRHLKVLGIFSRLHYRDGKSGYLGDLPRVYAYVADVAGRHVELQALAALLHRLVGTRDLRMPGSP
ncbi:MAG: phosphotransferase [Xanthomonadales bacterium]|nr:phosphotransferase [Xanthomonadales bacterium]